MFAVYDPTLVTNTLLIVGLVVVGIGIYHIKTKRALIKRPYNLFFYRWEEVRGRHAVCIGYGEVLCGILIAFMAFAWPFFKNPAGRPRDRDAPNVAPAMPIPA